MTKPRKAPRTDIRAASTGPVTINRLCDWCLRGKRRDRKCVCGWKCDGVAWCKGDK